MAYRVFEEVSDTRPMPSGFATGFNPIIPTEEQVKAVKQKQEQERIEKTLTSPELKFAENAKIDQEFFNVNKGIIGQQFKKDLIEKKEIQPETLSFFNNIQQLAGKSISDIQAQEDAIKLYGNNPAYKQRFSIYSSQYGGNVEQRPSGVEYYGAIGKEPEKFYDLNVGAKGFVDNLGTISTQIDRKTGVGGVTSEQATSLKSKFKNGVVDNDAINAFYQADPVNQRSVNFNRELTDIAAVNTTKHKTGTRKKQNTDGTITTEVVTFGSPEELATAYSKGEAYPSDDSGNPLKGFESRFNVEERNNQVAKNYLLTASGYERSNERSTVIDQNEAGVSNGYGFGINTRKDIALTRGSESTAVQENGLTQKLIGIGLPEKDAQRLQFESRSVLIPQVIKDGKNELISIEGVSIPQGDEEGNFIDTYIGSDGKPVTLVGQQRKELPKNVKIANIEPIVTNSNGARVIIPDELNNQQTFDYLVQRTGTNPRGKMKTELVVNLVTPNEADANKLDPIVYRVKNYQDPLWLKFVTTTTPNASQAQIQKRAKKMYDEELAKSPYAKTVPEVVKTQEKNSAKVNTPVKKKVTPAPANKPKVKQQF